jgi:hypothetical protein
MPPLVDINFVFCLEPSVGLFHFSDRLGNKENLKTWCELRV